MNQVRIFAGTLLLSAVLLFVVQPMVGRMLLPTLGGTAVVWATSLVFFQAVLLAGYLYAHFATRWLGVRRQAAVHLVLMAAAAITLPIVFDTKFDPSSSPIPWLLENLTLEVGLVFFLVSTSAPMLQRWYASMDAPGADDPYFLYAASNFGSLVGLLSYPFVVEPFLELGEQSMGWAIGYALLIASTALAAAQVWRHGREASVRSVAATPSPSWKRRLTWIALAFVPSSMLLGATNQITTDLAAIPLLWVIPLGLYILSFVLVFARRRFFTIEQLMRPMVVSLLAVAVVMGSGAVSPLPLLIALHLTALTLVCLVYHGALVNDRPDVAHLTEFYIWMSLGGVLGGAFNALVAPSIFDEMLEYPLMICVALAWLPTGFFLREESGGNWKYWALVGAALSGLLAFIAPALGSYTSWLPVLAILAVTTTALAFRPRVAMLVLAVLTMITSSTFLSSSVIERERSAYGAYRIDATQTDAGKFHELVHGNTTHGTQARTKSIESLPLAYFHPKSPLGQVMVKRWEQGFVDDIGVVGLGCGAMAAYAREGMSMEFFEIDPVVVDLATDPRYFTFLEMCAERCSITVGDGRLQLATKPDEIYDVLVLDAYNSDSVPIHLLTREAVELYLQKLKPRGVLLFQATNRHTDIVGIVAAISRELGLVAKSQRFWPREAYLYSLEVSTSEYVVVARDEAHLSFLGDDPRWIDQAGDPAAPVWTDSYANLLYYYTLD